MGFHEAVTEQRPGGPRSRLWSSPVSLFDLGPAPFYVPPADRRDEMVDHAGAVRPVWARVHSHLLASGADSLQRDASRIQRRLHSHGAAFEMNSGDHRRWRLDPVPMVVERAEWAAVGRGLVQRARVLEAVLADVFGEQRLLRSGLLPIDAIVSHRDYLRPCIGVPPGGGRHLVLHAADVARLPDGSFSVLADRTQAPSGAGYTLENREVLSATYPELVRSSGVEPLRPWFSALRLTLAEVAPPGVDDPRIVILTPGPLSETYFEHGFLSRALGYTLVEPTDLTVRDGQVWLKSVSGLEPVHVILRRQDAEWCDSLELRPDSLLGVPGLVEAARRRNVSIVNPLGSGLTENPALLPYLGSLTRSLFGEDPLIDSAPTWWCGEPTSRSHVLSNLHRLVIKQVNRGRGRQSTFGRLLTPAQREDLAARITAQPHLYVGQEEQSLSTAPALGGDTIVAHSAVLRAFLVAESDGFVWMDGGLTRTADHPDGVTMSAGGTSKDTWVVAPPSEHSWVARRAVALPQVDLRDSVTASSAASMFWIGRNLERAETIIRLVRSIDEALGLWPELRDEADGAWVDAMGAAVVAMMHDEDEPGPEQQPPLDAASVRALGDPTLSRSLTTSLRYLVRGGRSVRGAPLDRRVADAQRTGTAPTAPRRRLARRGPGAGRGHHRPVERVVGPGHGVDGARPRLALLGPRPTHRTDRAALHLAARHAGGTVARRRRSTAARVGAGRDGTAWVRTAAATAPMSNDAAMFAAAGRGRGQPPLVAVPGRPHGRGRCRPAHRRALGRRARR